MKELTEEQMTRLCQDAADLASAAARDNLPQVLVDLRAQMAENPDANEITLRLALDVMCLQAGGKWDLVVTPEWQAQRPKRRGEKDSREVDFDNPALPFPKPGGGEPSDPDFALSDDDAQEQEREQEQDAIHAEAEVEAASALPDHADAAPPPGDDGWDWDDQCKCGHARDEHDGMDGAGRCKHLACSCQEFALAGAQAQARPLSGESHEAQDAAGTPREGAGEFQAGQQDHPALAELSTHDTRNVLKLLMAGYTPVYLTLDRKTVMAFNLSAAQARGFSTDWWSYDTRAACTARYDALMRDPNSIEIRDLARAQVRLTLAHRRKNGSVWVKDVATEGRWVKAKPQPTWDDVCADPKMIVEADDCHA